MEAEMEDSKKKITAQFSNVHYLFADLKPSQKSVHLYLYEVASCSVSQTSPNSSCSVLLNARVTHRDEAPCSVDKVKTS